MSILAGGTDSGRNLAVTVVAALTIVLALLIIVSCYRYARRAFRRSSSE